MSYQINGTTIAQPSTAKWLERRSFGVDGDGRPIYGRTREYQLQWDFISDTDFQTLYNFYNTYRASGSVVVTLPRYASDSDVIYPTSGCILNEPVPNEYFEGYLSDVILVVKVIVQ